MTLHWLKYLWISLWAIELFAYTFLYRFPRMDDGIHFCSQLTNVTCAVGLLWCGGFFG